MQVPMPDIWGYLASIHHDNTTSRPCTTPTRRGDDFCDLKEAVLLSGSALAACSSSDNTYIRRSSITESTCRIYLVMSSNGIWRK